MNKKEKEIIIGNYRDKMESYKLFKNSEKSQRIQFELHTLKTLNDKLFGYAESVAIDNKARLEVLYENKVMLCAYVDSINSWLRQIERELEVEILPYKLNVNGLAHLGMHYDWIDNEKYSGFFKAIDGALEELKKI